MLTLVYANDGNKALERAEALRLEYPDGIFQPREIKAYCGHPERCSSLVMLDPSERIEKDHKCDVQREYGQTPKSSRKRAK